MHFLNISTLTSIVVSKVTSKKSQSGPDSSLTREFPVNFDRHSLESCEWKWKANWDG